ncbi:cytochrome P450 family protein [Amycolatopsis kentuckyensis]|uniref:cytochrome P450 family protein n=1 Tax=Amycolatopsis kentuckyensis TaxID=218823 RepID=UPI00356B2898
MTVNAFFSPYYWDHAHEVAAALREQGPVHRAMIPRGEGEKGIPVWVVARYEDARAALTDTRLSKDVAGLAAILHKLLAEAGADTTLSSMFSPHMIFSDPPRHTRLRNLLVRHFTRTRIEALKPRVEQLTAELVENLPLHQEVDLITEVAFPLPLYVICELIGVPEDKRGMLRAWTYALMEDLPGRADAASQSMQDYLLNLIEIARAHPGDDLLSALVQEAEDENRLSLEELVGTLFLLFVAGHETTTALIGNGIRWLLDDPQVWGELGQHPQLLPGAVKEVSRFDAPVATATHRFTTTPVTIGETTIPPGEIVLISLLSANRDGRRYARPDELDIRRDKSNLAFGHGIHYCLGAQLGQMEAEIVIGALARRFPDARLAVEATQLRRRQPAMIPNSYVDLPAYLG